MNRKITIQSFTHATLIKALCLILFKISKAHFSKSERNGESVCSARELHAFLEVREAFTDWCKRMFEYGFEAEKDFIRIFGESTGGRPSTDYALTLDCAKEISMLQRSEKGKQLS